MDKKPSLIADRLHTSQASDRWGLKYQHNRRSGEEGYKTEWYFEQCFACQYYILLQGHLSTDWGVCSHPESPFDGRLMFEHDGCEYFSRMDEDDDEDLEIDQS